MKRRSMELFAVWTVAAVLLVSCTTSRTSISASPPLTPPSREVLPNGLRLIIQEHRTAEVVSVQLWVGVGGRDEAPSERGFSHFAEHMLFKGTERLGPGFVDSEVERVGGRTNAATSLDYTYYYMLLPSRRAERAIEVMADMAFNSTFDSTELAREREVVFEEVRLGEDNPRSFLVRRLYELVFTAHPYGFPVLGDPAALRAASRETLRGYYKRHYVPANMTLVVVGAVDPASVRAAAVRAFGDAAGGSFRRVPLPPQPALGENRRQSLERSERQASLGLGWRAPKLRDQDMYAVDLLAHILGGSLTSRLTQSLRERTRLVSTISAGYGTLEGGGAVTVTAQLEAKDLEKAEAAILAEIRRIQEDGVTTAEVERAVTAAEAQRVFGRETAEGLALAYGRAETVWSLEEDRGYVERLNRVTRKQIQEAARRYLVPSYARLALVPKRAGS
ncbi:MAG TPA: pitrilysin family protein [Methylomirabilota bacterium]|nr:pitrilysin family protein [Methylomirabilota bacterium]